MYNKYIDISVVTFEGGVYYLDKTTKHLDYLQENIARMNRCSFQMKGWTITIVTALIALAATGIGTFEFKSVILVLIGIFPTVAFWALDSYYLMKEKDLITVFNIVAGIKESSIKIKDYEIMPDLKEQKTEFKSVFKSASEAGLYGSIIGLLVLISVVLFILCKC